MSSSNKQYIKLAIIYFFNYAAYTSYFSFISMYLRQNNYNMSDIGLIFMLISLVNIFAQPLLSFLAVKVFSLRKVSVTLIVASVVLSFTLLPAISILSFTALSIITVSICDYAIRTMIDSLASLSTDKYPNINYSVIRAMGSISSAVTALFVGEILLIMGNEKMLIFHALFLSVTLFFLLWLEDVQHKTEDGENIKNKAGLIKNKKFIYFIIAVFLVNIGWRAILTYIPVVLVDLGGTSAHQGRSMFFMTIGIAPVMFLYPKLKKKFGVENMLILGFVLMTIRVLSMTLISNVSSAMYLQLFEAFSFGVFAPASIEYITLIIERESRPQALSLYHVVVSAVSGIAGNYFAGIIYENYGYKMMYFIFSIFGLIGTLLIIWSISKPMKQKN